MDIILAQVRVRWLIISTDVCIVFSLFVFMIPFVVLVTFLLRLERLLSFLHLIQSNLSTVMSWGWGAIHLVNMHKFNWAFRHLSKRIWANMSSRRQTRSQTQSRAQEKKAPDLEKFIQPKETNRPNLRNTKPPKEANRPTLRKITQ